MFRKVVGTRVAVVLVLTLASSVIAGTAAFAADWASVREEAKVKYDRFEQEIKDMTVIQEMKFTIPEGEMRSENTLFRKGEKFRTDTTMNMPGGVGEMQTIIIFDGKDTWVISSFLGKKKVSGEEEKQYSMNRNWWEWIPEKAKIVGSEKVSKRKCYVVEIYDQKDSPLTKMWLDEKALMLVKGEGTGAQGKTATWLNSDFKKIKGDWEIPYKTEMYVDGEIMSTSTVKSVKINEGLSDDLFNPNEVKVKGLNLKDIIKQVG